MTTNINTNNTVAHSHIMDNGNTSTPVTIEGACTFKDTSGKFQEGVTAKASKWKNSHCVPKTWIFSKEEAMARARQILTKN